MNTHSIHLKYRAPKRYPTIISIMPSGVAPIVAFRGSNNRCLEQIFMVPKRFEPSKFDCNFLGTQKQVRINNSKRSIGIRVIDALL